MTVECGMRNVMKAELATPAGLQERPGPLLSTARSCQGDGLNYVQQEFANHGSQIQRDAFFICLQFFVVAI